ncbi:MAG: hypothetical protein HOV68_27130 [Streptomycetaceae bacterium]|nr:hypothetical protein [Streptomycetaceae bacterium]
MYTSGSPSGTVWFKSDGDVWTIYDWAKDGHGVGVWFRVNEGPAQLLVNNNGYNTSVKYDKDYVEGSKIRFMACLTEQGGVWDCDGTWSSAVFPGTSATA